MTHPNNGATLEDCHSNFFALTDLCGIRWRRLVSEGPGHPQHFGPMDDPVLSSYARVLAADILCVWRRCPSARDPFTPQTPNPNAAFLHQHPHMMPPGLHGHGHGPPPYHHPHGFSPQLSPMPQQQQPQNNFPNQIQASLNGPKELWIFWYGEEPDLHGLVNAQLLNKADPDQGSWESGLSYDCRTLLFKALHNLIEKCLLARDFVRIGKWFIQPTEDNPRKGVKTFPMQLSFSFAFFLHGESTVCMSVDVRQHPIIRRVGASHLSSMGAPLPVLLAPHGLSGVITGLGYRMNEPATNKILDEWKQFYPVEAALKSPAYDTSIPPASHSSPNSSSQYSSSGIPPVLEVLVGGVRLRYPACYVLVTESEVGAVKYPKSRSGGGIVDSESAATPSAASSPAKPVGCLTTPTEICKVEGALPERVWQEAILCSSKEAMEVPRNGPACTTLGQWDYFDPMKRSPCICTKCKRSSSSKSQFGSSSTKRVKRSTFHRRAPKYNVRHWADQWDLKGESATTPGNFIPGKHPHSSSEPHHLYNHSSANRGGALPGTPLGGPPSFKTGPGSMSTTGLGSEEPYECSAPSPLATPRSQPASVPSNNEPCMPTLSPQPLSDKTCIVSPDNYAPKSVSSISHQVYSPMVGCYEGAIRSSGVHDQSTQASSPDPSGSKDAETQSMMKGLLIRPFLPSKEYETILIEENSSKPSEKLYDYSVLQAWLCNPVKRFKGDNGLGRASFYSWGLGMNKTSICMNRTNTFHERHQLGKRAADPYEFDDENAPPLINMEMGLGIKPRKEEKEEEKIKEKENISNLNNPYSVVDNLNGNKVASGNLFTNEGLQPSIRDLDNLFDNSDTSSDETFQVPTPPGSNKPAGPEETTSIPGNNSSSSKGRSALGALRPEELSKMFPTPPSHEPNPISSPIGLPEGSSLEDSVTFRETRRDGRDSYMPGSPAEEAELSLSMRTAPEISLNLKLEPATIFGNRNGNGNNGGFRLNVNDWSFVFKPPSVHKMMGSSKYAPLPSLPSSALAPLTLPGNAIYKASWQGPQTQNHTHNQHTHNIHPIPHPMLAGSNIAQLHLRPGLSPISPVPNSVRGGQFDLGSPPSNSMYLKGGPPNGPGVGHGHGHGHGHPQMYGVPPKVEAHALVVNLSLSDSVINLFRDHNFDSCTMCVCNASNKVIGNIRGSEVGLYIQDSAPEEEPVRCNCGFSATVNRRLAHRSGLFYEDEYEITTPSVAPIALPNDEWYERKKPSFLLLPARSSSTHPGLDQRGDAAGLLDDIPPYLLEMLREQCIVLFGNNVASRFTGDLKNKRWELTYNILECVDANRAALTALEHGRTVMEAGRPGYGRLPDEALILRQNLGLMHKWSFRCARGPRSSQDFMQVMRGLLPLLQEAVHAKAWDAQYTVSGPLTWRHFHRLAGRGTEDRCEPQPIPSILVGSEKDWIALSPLAIKFWEKLLLEPYSYARDVAYFVVCPENDFILNKVRLFFREFSSMYEICQLGRHCAISKVVRDGIMRVGKSAANNLASEPVDEWFRTLPDNPTAAALKLYAQVCRHYLAPQLAKISLDHSLFTPHNQKMDRAHSKIPPPTIDVTGGTQGPPTPKTEPGVHTNAHATHNSNDSGDAKDAPPHDPCEDDEKDPPAIVIYIVEPFGFGSDNPNIHRLAKLGLLRCFHSMLNFVPEHIRNNITLQIISLEDIVNLGNSTLETRLKNDQMRALALSVYSQCRRLLTHASNVKSLTGFGPAAAADLFIKNKDEKCRAGYKLYTPPYILAPTKDRLSEGSEWLNALQGHTTGGLVSTGNPALGPGATPSVSSVLYVAYCLSDDQRWLLASVTDDRGELLETTTINIYVPNRSKRRKVNARKHGLVKLMDFILGIMSTGVSPWRLVVGRLGRIGHGELESWSTLLSRKSLLRASNQLKVLCSQCSLQFPNESPCVLSACLVSLEPDSALRLMPDKFTPDERFSNSGTSASLNTPHDISCTHILVFPTSATTQSSQTAFQEQHMNDGPELGDDSDLLFMVNDGIEDGIDGMTDLQLGDIFNWPDPGAGPPSPVGSPRRDSTSQPGSPGIGASGRQSPFQSGGQGRIGSRGEGGDEVGTLLQQPLALGYYVSTAPSGPLPPWFWASCPQRANENNACVFLKSALHLHSHSVFHNVDDPLQQQSNAKQHPLDSQYTTDVLRFALEGYNALSWLSLDIKTHDRRSCLPVHIQQLLQLYYAMSALV